MTSGDLGGDPAWPTFGPFASAPGVNSVMSLPVVLADEVLGSLTSTPSPPTPFSPVAIDVGRQFAVPAAVVIHNARRRRFVQLRVVSQREQVEPALVAAGIVDEAVSRARARASSD